MVSMHSLSPCKAVQGVADRVMLGLLPSSQCAWGTALAALKDQGGWLHLHSNVKDSDEAAWSQATLVCPHACMPWLCSRKGAPHDMLQAEAADSMYVAGVKKSQ